MWIQEHVLGEIKYKIRTKLRINEKPCERDRITENSGNVNVCVLL